ncbi:hypothetical protein PG996_002081 [Apiospora saccharicola]|uniref:Uncharacterized protein n=1 Tax=Apiospora saccharicola TaxID=335842 RepID=A0ABR1WLD6_9PEZI
MKHQGRAHLTGGTMDLAGGGGLPPIDQDQSVKRANKQMTCTKQKRRAHRVEGRDNNSEIYKTDELNSLLETPANNDAAFQQDN